METFDWSQALTVLLAPAGIVALINAALRNAIPIVLGALSGIVSERSGVVNIGIEGMMLAGAFTGYMANVYLSAPGSLTDPALQPIRLILCTIVALVTGGLLATLHGLLSIRYKVDQVISGTVINILSLGITGYLYVQSTSTRGGYPPAVVNPFSQENGVLFYIGQVVFNKDLLTYLTLLLVPVLGFLLFRTTWGLRTRAIGEKPRAADTLGINVHRNQFANLFLSGMLAGMAGATLTLASVSFERGMSNGRGFLALAVMIFGAWRPSRAFVGALLIGFLTALQGQLQFAGFDRIVPHQLIATLPYVMTLIVLAGFGVRARPPASVGEAYETG
jgi:general nucleoside transport system permease protein